VNIAASWNFLKVFMTDFLNFKKKMDFINPYKSKTAA